MCWEVGMTVKIEVREMDMRSDRTVEVRMVSTQTTRALTAPGATRILRREFPELPRTISASKLLEKKGSFVAMHAVSPTEKCNFHYVWRKFYLTEVKG
jgi:hypothetical protein